MESDEPNEVFMVPVMVADLVAGRQARQARSIDVLSGQRLEYVRLDDVIVLSFAGGHQVLIETVAHLNSPAGRTAVEPGDDVIATLLGDVVRRARTRDSGELELCFASGSELVVGADDDFESWAVTSPDGFLMVCLAGGELAVWNEAPACLRV